MHNVVYLGHLSDNWGFGSDQSNLAPRWKTLSRAARQTGTE